MYPDQAGELNGSCFSSAVTCRGLFLGCATGRVLQWFASTLSTFCMPEQAVAAGAPTAGLTAAQHKRRSAAAASRALRSNQHAERLDGAGGGAGRAAAPPSPPPPAGKGQAANRAPAIASSAAGAGEPGAGGAQQGRAGAHTTSYALRTAIVLDWPAAMDAHESFDAARGAEEALMKVLWSVVEGRMAAAKARAYPLPRRVTPAFVQAKYGACLRAAQAKAAVDRRVLQGLHGGWRCQTHFPSHSVNL